MPIPPSCERIGDSPSREICIELTHRYGIDPATMDRGVSENRLNGTRVVAETLGTGDGVIVPELTDRALKICRDEYRQGITDFCQFLSGRILLPLIPDDFRPDTQEDTLLRSEVGAIVQGLGPHLSETSREMERARLLYVRLVQSPEVNGLGIQHDSQDNSSPRTLTDVYRDRRAICLEFVNFYLMVADRAEIEGVVPIEVYQSETPHVAVGFVDRAGRVIRVIDIARERGGRGGFFTPSENDRIGIISRLLLHAYFYEFLADKEQDPMKAEELMDRGLLLAPFNYLLLTGKAYFLHERYLKGRDLGLLATAISLLQAASDRNPLYRRTQRNLQRAEGERASNPSR